MPTYETVREEIEAKYQCDHTPEIRKKVLRDGQPWLGTQCTECGIVIGTTLSPKGYTEPAIKELPLWDLDLEKSYRSKIQSEVASAWKEVVRKKHEERRKRYTRHLKTAKWEKLREKVLIRAHHRCEGCGSADATEVHHLTYDRLGNEMLFDLVAVCKPCHQMVHLDREMDVASESQNNGGGPLPS